MNDNSIKKAANEIMKHQEKTFLKLRVSELEDKVRQLESFIETQLGLSSCAVPTSYCSSCACGKKELIEGKKK